MPSSRRRGRAQSPSRAVRAAVGVRGRRRGWAESPSRAVRAAVGVRGGRSWPPHPRRCCCPLAWRSPASHCRALSSGPTGRSGLNCPTRRVMRSPRRRGGRLPRTRRLRPPRPPSRPARARPSSARATRELATGGTTARNGLTRPAQPAGGTSPACQEFGRRPVATAAPRTPHTAGVGPRAASTGLRLGRGRAGGPGGGGPTGRRRPGRPRRARPAT